MITLMSSASMVSAQAFGTTSCQATPEGAALLAVLDQWNTEVWEQGHLERVADFVGPSYVRHEATGTRTVTPEEYAAEIAGTRGAMPDLRFVLHDCAAIGDRVWTRWTMVATNPQTRLVMKRMGMQTYRIIGGRLVETWMLMLPSDAAWAEERDTIAPAGRPNTSQ